MDCCPYAAWDHLIKVKDARASTRTLCHYVDMDKQKIWFWSPPTQQSIVLNQMLHNVALSQQTPCLLSNLVDRLSKALVFHSVQRSQGAFLQWECRIWSLNPLPAKRKTWYWICCWAVLGIHFELERFWTWCNSHSGGTFVAEWENHVTSSVSERRQWLDFRSYVKCLALQKSEVSAVGDQRDKEAEDDAHLVFPKGNWTNRSCGESSSARFAPWRESPIKVLSYFWYCMSKCPFCILTVATSHIQFTLYFHPIELLLHFLLEERWQKSPGPLLNWGGVLPTHTSPLKSAGAWDHWEDVAGVIPLKTKECLQYVADHYVITHYVVGFL